MAPRLAGAALLALLVGATRAARAWPAEAALPADVVGAVLRFAPRAPQVAWCAGSPAAPPVVGRPRERPFRDLGGHRGHANNVAFSPSGRSVLTTDSDGAARVWDAPSGRLRQTLRHNGSFILDVQVLSSGDRAVTLTLDGLAMVWDLNTGQALRRIHSRVARHRVLRALPFGDRFITGASRTRAEIVVVWCATTGFPLHVIRQPEGAVKLIEVSPCGARFATSGYGGIFVWRAADGVLERKMAGSAGSTSMLALARGGSRVAGSSQDLIRVWSASTGRVLNRFVIGAGGVSRPFVLLAGGDRVAVYTTFGPVVWDTRSDEVRTLEAREISTYDGRVRLAASADGRFLAACSSPWLSWASTADSGAWMAVWDTTSGRRVHDASSLADAEAIPGNENTWFCSVAVGPTTAMAEAFADALW